MNKTLIGENIRRERERLGISVNELARRAKVNRGNLSKIENGLIGASFDALARIADILEIPLDTIRSEKSNVTRVKEKGRRFPLLAWHQIEQWLRGTLTFPKDGLMQTAEFYVASSADTFGLQVEGDSMEESTGIPGADTFRHGDLILVDPLLTKPKPGAYVIASLGTGGHILRRYRDLGPGKNGKPEFELLALNRLYPKLHSIRDDLKIVGTAIAFLRHLKK